MYLLSKDKKILISFGSEGCHFLEIHRNFGEGKEKKFALMGGGLVLNTYPEEKNAMDEMEKIVSAIELGQMIYKID